MKRMWIGIAFLLVVLTVGSILTIAFGKLHEPLADTLQQAADAALQENWQKALKLSLDARGRWEKARHFTAAVADHEPLEEIDQLFGQLQVWEREKNTAKFASTASQLAVLARAMADSQAITWWNLL